jgi:hypothetical protein
MQESLLEYSKKTTNKKTGNRIQGEKEVKIMGEKPSGGQTTTCDKCEEPRVIYPPTPDYTQMLLQPCPEGDSIERAFECEKCGEMNTRHWDKEHILIASSDDDQDRQPV